MAESLFIELKRRNVFKVATAYIVLAWVVIQVTETVVPALLLPEWINTAVVLFGLLGFPFVLLFAWAFELTPEGIKRESEVDRTESITHNTGQKLNYVIMTLLAVGMSYFIYESRFMDDEKNELVETAATNQADSSQPGEDEELEARLSELGGSSIAVLPFVNMSSDPEQEFFSDGISEEILNVLAKIPNLHVTSRSSAFAFKGKEINLSEVAQKLGVANILEGSVRKAGNKVRITAQLIEADTDKHLWSETYDRELNDIFAIQDEISGAIVIALKEKLGIDQVDIKATEVVDIAAHEAYLRGKFLVEKRNQPDLEKALLEFDKAIEIEPGYAKAWMGKAWANHFLNETQYGNIPIALALERAQRALDMAMKLNPDLPENYGIQGLLHNLNNNEEKANQAYEKAIALNPNYSLAYAWYANTLYMQPEKRLEMSAIAYRLDPINLLAANNYIRALVEQGLYGQAQEVSDQMVALQPEHFLTSRSKGYLLRNMGHYGEGTYYSKITNDKNSSITYMFNAANALATIGLIAEAINVYAGTDLSEQQYVYSQNNELYITETLNKYPRVDNDRFGHYLAAYAHFENQDFKPAIEHFNQVPICESLCPEMILSYKQAGDEEGYQRILEKFRTENQILLDANFQDIDSTVIFSRIELYSGNVDGAIKFIEDDLMRGRPIDFTLIRKAWYNEPLHNHEKWPELVEASSVLVKREQQIYRDLVANQSGNEKSKDTVIGQGT